MSPWAPLVKPLAGVLTLCALVAELLAPGTAHFVSRRLRRGHARRGFLARRRPSSFRRSGMSARGSSSATAGGPCSSTWRGRDADVLWRRSSSRRSTRPTATSSSSSRWRLPPGPRSRPTSSSRRPSSRSSTGRPRAGPAHDPGRWRVPAVRSTRRSRHVAELYAQLGLLALLFVLLNVVAFTYMARLVITARERTRQYATLSWGVLCGLIRTLDERDSRAARHCAAVAALLPRHRPPGRHVQARPGARTHRGAAARHRQVRPLRPRHGARRAAGGRRLARHPPPPRHRRRAAARHRRLRAGGRDRPRPPRAPGRPRLPARPHRATRSRRSPGSSPSPRSTTRSPRRTPTARR